MEDASECDSEEDLVVSHSSTLTVKEAKQSNLGLSDSELEDDELESGETETQQHPKIARL